LKWVAEVLKAKRGVKARANDAILRECPDVQKLKNSLFDTEKLRGCLIHSSPPKSSPI
jgi:hypothetical protein